MSLLSHRLEIKVQQKHILSHGLVQMVELLQKNMVELREEIRRELSENPALEESAELGEELTPEEIHAELERLDIKADSADQGVIERFENPAQETDFEADNEPAVRAAPADTEPEPEPAAKTADTFEETDFDFNDFLDPGYRTPASEPSDKPSFETFLSSPVTLAKHLESQLALIAIPAAVREAADSIIGNLDDNGYLSGSLATLAEQDGHRLTDLEAALKEVQGLDPAGIGARDLRECLLLQLDGRLEGSVAWKIVHNHLNLVASHRFADLARAMGRPLDHIVIAMKVIRRLDPYPGQRHMPSAAKPVVPDVYIRRDDGGGYLIDLNDDDVPQLRLNSSYRRMLDRDQAPDKEVRNYVRERYASALMLMKNIEQRRQTIRRVCEVIVDRQGEFLDQGIDWLRPMMIKDVAGEIGVHPSTVSRAVANKYCHTSHGVFELRYFFSEAVQGVSGASTPLLVLKRKVKKLIDEEDPARPLTDEQLMDRLKAEGIEVTRRTVAKYREDMKIPSTHQRRARNQNSYA